jgi:hypothetical protein
MKAIPGGVLCRKHGGVYMLNFAGLQQFDVGIDRYLECHYLNLYTTMQLAVDRVNSVWGTSFSMRPSNCPLSLIPCIPDTDCSLFDAWRLKNTNLCILYYNFQPCSAQSIGISPNAHEGVLYALCNRFPDATILVPMFSDALKSATWRPHNLLSCEESFGCAVAPDCENLCMLAKIETRCDVSVHFDIGACFYYAGSTFYDTNCKILHASRDHFYYHRLKENFRMSDEEYAKKAVPVLATTDTDAFIQRLVQEIEGLQPLQQPLLPLLSPL